MLSLLVFAFFQLAVFAYNSVAIDASVGSKEQSSCSHLIFDPEKRFQIWRYITYMFIHSGLFHISFNLLVQLILGIPLEMVHGKTSKTTGEILMLGKSGILMVKTNVVCEWSSFQISS